MTKNTYGLCKRLTVISLAYLMILTPLDVYARGKRNCDDGHGKFNAAWAKFTHRDKAEGFKEVAKAAGTYLQLFSSLRPTGGHVSAAKGASAKSLALLKDYLVPMLKGLAPVSEWNLKDVSGQNTISYERLGRGVTHEIFLKLFKDPNYKPTNREMKILRETGNEQWFLQVREYNLKHPWIRKAHKSLYYFKAAAKWAIVAGILAMVKMMLEEDGMISYEEFAEKRIGTGPEKYQAQLIAETVPFPHMAIRLGETVYSYGQTHLTGTPVSEYLNSKKLQQAITVAIKEGVIKLPEPEEMSEDAKKGSSAISTAYLGQWAWAAADKVGLSDLPRSVQVATINLSEEEYLSIREELIEHTSKRYANTTFVNDCATMVARIIGKHTDLDFSRLIDASPGQMIMKLALLKAGGSRYVEDVQTVMIADTHKPMTHMWRNTFINYMEAMTFLKLFTWNQTHRLIIDGWHDERSIQFLEDEVKEARYEFTDAMKSLTLQRPNLVNLTSAVVYFEKRGPEINATLREQKRAELIRLADAEFNEAINDVSRAETSRIIDTRDRFILPMKKALYIETKAEYIARIKRVQAKK